MWGAVAGAKVCFPLYAEVGVGGKEENEEEGGWLHEGLKADVDRQRGVEEVAKHRG